MILYTRLEIKKYIYPNKTLLPIPIPLCAANRDILAKTLFFKDQSKSVEGGNSDNIIAL